MGCYGDQDGTATTFASGGTAPYTYLWNNGSTEQESFKP
ncbi:MAG: SprB repeat-containing protein [Bacteroidetes bacterium]|nr:SprB repeat-containing protein [Bacteroidota bacterium]